MAPTKQQVLDSLAKIADPDGSPLTSSGKLSDVMVSDGKVRSRQGSDAPVQADTLCIHGDEPGAVEFAKRVRAALDADGIRVAPIAHK